MPRRRGCGAVGQPAQAHEPWPPALLPVFFLLPLSVAFGDRPVLTAVLGVGTAACYLGAWIVYSKRDDHVACRTWSICSSGSCCGRRWRRRRCAGC